MTSETETHLQTLTLPYGREAVVKNVEFDSGMTLLRLTIREGRRFTIVDLDADSARDLGGALMTWAHRGEKQ